MIRIFDFLLSLIGLVILSPFLLTLSIIGLFDTGKPFFIQQRVGINKKAFSLIKFRTMHPNTKSVATHLANQNSITKFGRFLRKTKLDELPQLVNVLLGDMSLVGPRPNLYNQEELIEERDKRGVYSILPGITGLSQIREIDMSTPEKLALSDAEMAKEMNIRLYFYYIFATISGKGSGDRIKIK